MRLLPTRVRELAEGDALVMALVEPLLAILATMLGELARLTKQVLDIVHGEEVCRRLMSVPGVARSPHSPSAPRSTGRSASAARGTWVRISA